MHLGDDVIDEGTESAELVILLWVLGVMIRPVPLSPGPRNPRHSDDLIDTLCQAFNGLLQLTKYCGAIAEIL